MVLFFKRPLNVLEYWQEGLFICALLTLPALSTDPASHCYFTEVHLWETHFGQAREILHEEWIWTGTNWRSHKWPLVIKFRACILWWSVWAGHPPPTKICDRCSIAIGLPFCHLEELPKTKKDKSTPAGNAVRDLSSSWAPHQAQTRC